MCASYGLQVTADELHDDFGTLDERGSAPALAEWLQQHAEKPVKPTGVHALNLNPIVREREREGERRRTIDLAWWKLWVGGEPAKFPAINARVEKLLSSGAWSGPTKSRRALVPVTSYLEKGRSFELPEGLFALAVGPSPEDAGAASIPESGDAAEVVRLVGREAGVKRLSPAREISNLFEFMIIN